MISRICCLISLCWSTRLLADPMGFTSLATAAIGFDNCDTCTGLGPAQTDPLYAYASAWETFTYGTPPYLPTYTGLMFADATAQVLSVGFDVFSLSVRNDVGDFTGGEGGPNALGMATAAASFSDTITIYGGQGIANLAWDYADSNASSYGGGIAAGFNLPTQVMFGVPFDIGAFATIRTLESNPFFGGCLVTADFSLFGLSVNGDSQSWQYSTGSNIDYGFTETAVGDTFIATAEPPYFWLIGTLLVVGAGFARKVKVRPVVAC